MTEKQQEKLQVCENNDEKYRVSENNRQATNGGADGGNWSEGESRRECGKNGRGADDVESG